MNIWRNRFIGIGLLTLLVSSLAFAGESSPKKTKRNAPLDIAVNAWGPTQTEVDAAKRRVEQSSVVQDKLQGSKYRLVAFEYIENGGGDKSQSSQPPIRFRVIFYNYTNDIALIAEGDFAAREAIVAREEFYDPNIGSEEIQAAFGVVRRDAEFQVWNRQRKLELYEPMPPVSNLNGERLVNIGVRNLESGENQIVGVSFKNENVIRYANDAPPSVRATPEACGVSSSGGSTGQGIAGQYQLSVAQGGSPLWEMLVIRPSSSTGGEGSGIEIRDVKYKGKSVMKRGHAPILNVKYLPGGNCNQFRDWQYAEGFFNAPAAGATDPAPGIRVLANGEVATTVVESRVDAGNFQGVAIYRQDVGYGNELVMVSEMNAGWYRYIMEWRFAPDGTIRPRYGFGSITNSCTCSPRNHHVYWRFDFDIVQPNNKIFQVERGRRFLKPIETEAAIFRNYQTNRGFLIQNSNGDEAYQITPNLTDEQAYFQNPNGGILETYGAGDFWLLRFQGTATSPDELNDPNTSSAANLAPWLTNESLVNQDAVIWYAAHQYRVDDASRSNSPDVLTGRHVIGPDLRPVRW